MTIFDTSNLEDLPAELIKELKLAGDVDNILLNLFYDASGVLDLSTLLVGYYRKHKEIKTRQYMMTTCYRLVKKGFLSPTKNKGEYQITSNGLSVIGKTNNEVNNEQQDEEDIDSVL
jgi:hypothetical protein